MEAIIAGVLKDLETGRISRRDAIRTLALAVGAASASVGAAAQAGKGLQTGHINHISYVVDDYKKTRDWYADVLGMPVSADDGGRCYLHFGDSVLIPRNRSPLNPDDKAPNVDHICYHIDDWNTDRVKAELERRGLKDTRGGPLRPGNGSGVQPNYVSFHTVDPDGFDVEISGFAKPGDSQYKKS